MKNLFIYFTLLFLLISCTQESYLIEDTNNEVSLFEALELASEITKDCNNCNTIAISATQIRGNTSQINFYKDIINEEFIKKESNYYFQNKKIAIENNNLRTYVNDDTEFSDFENSFGEIISLNFNDAVSKSTNSAQIEIYNPELIEITNKDLITEIDKNSNITINWVPDPENDKPISIILVSRLLESDGSPIDNVHLEKLVNDVGSHTINANELGIFPDKSTLDIALIRGNLEQFNNTIVYLYNSDILSARIDTFNN